MSVNKMLIDATHPEETRVVVLKQGRVEEFDYESAARKQLRGNIYLAKVTRVEPSLQAAFVEYGGNRHGFLAFSEIHPDYYQIPMADRQALLEQEAMAEAERAAADDAEVDDVIESEGTQDDESDDDFNDDADEVVSSNEDTDDDDDIDDELSATAEDQDASDTASQIDDDDSANDADAAKTIALDSDAGEAITAPASVDEGDAAPDLEMDEAPSEDLPETDADTADPIDTDAADTPAADAEAEADAGVNEIDPDDALEEVQTRPRRRPRSYKIQEVIKRRQVILVQVVKEERGNKGAALTTYLSLAGRYTVLMPNTARGGGISRKISNPQDRKRLKSIANELDVPEGMGLIVRTAGASRTKQELRRDFEYLLRLWESVRDRTLESSAPSLVYEEGNLIKRSIRDLYNKDVDEVLVAGGAAYKQAKDFMRMLMPSHAKNVVQHQKSESLFTIFGIERQLNAMFSPQVTLRSGGYLIINQTEALVAVDVNSGKATREFSIEETALATNLEAATEIARQLKLRDLAGLIVIDFIDMDERRNNRAVERRLKEALRHDRARIQFGRISHFGLMEMSRQRLRTGVLEGSTSQCPHCQGTGIIRSTDSVALAVLRAIEDAVVTGDSASIVAVTSPEAAIYILNHKRGFLNEIEHRHGIKVSVEASDKMQGANFTVGKLAGGAATDGGQGKNVVNMDWGFEPEPQPQENGNGRRRGRRGRGRGEADDVSANGEEQKPRRRRRRRGRRGDRAAQDQDQTIADANGDELSAENTNSVPGAGPQPDLDASDDVDTAQSDTATDESNNGEPRKPRRRRGRRGGNRDRNARRRTAAADNNEEDGGEAKDPSQPSDPSVDHNDERQTTSGDDAPSEPTNSSSTHESVPSESGSPPDDIDNTLGAPASSVATEPAPTAAEKPKRRSTSSSAPKLEHVLVTPDGSAGGNSPPDAQDGEQPSSNKRGWWSRKLSRD